MRDVIKSYLLYWSLIQVERNRDLNSILNKCGIRKKKAYGNYAAGQNLIPYRYKNGEVVVSFPQLWNSLPKKVTLLCVLLLPSPGYGRWMLMHVRHKNLCKPIHLPAQTGSHVFEINESQIYSGKYMDRKKLFSVFFRIARLQPICFVAFIQKQKKIIKNIVTDAVRSVTIPLSFLNIRSVRALISQAFTSSAWGRKKYAIARMSICRINFPKESNLRDMGKTFEVLVEGFLTFT
jgi:tRNA-2-methylthio-N6-dimethylallyladenosine synthase